MIFELFKIMMREEIRIHTKLFPSIFFYSLPFFVFAFSFLLSIFVLNVYSLLPIFISIFLIIGIASGGYTIHFREVYLRKFPHLNFLLYTYYSFPIKNEKIVFALFLKEITFFTFWIFLPLTLGLFKFDLYSLFVSFSFYLLGNSSSFLLSNFYNRKIILIPLIILFATFFTYFFNFLFSYPIINLLTSFSLLLISIKTLDIEYKARSLTHKNYFSKIYKLIKNPLLVKDLIDFKRSYGFARAIFSIIIPLFLAYFLFQVMVSIGIKVDFEKFFSMMIGFVSITFYDVLTEFDRWVFYSIFPLRKNNVIKSKAGISIIFSTLVIFLFSILGFANFLISFISMLYLLSIIIFLVGLDTMLLFDIRRILLFSVLFVPFFLFVLFFYKALYTFLFLIISVFLLFLGFKKFD
ncbi:MAG: hypothetical protein QW641_02195 [Candidatus Aenigmatarchaeota archaeon]